MASEGSGAVRHLSPRPARGPPCDQRPANDG